ncbi:MAG: MBL fold metallo-hydrolase [Candidatus Bathyarchaeota archaeon]|nr:MBL fold metallo-hydrolase [Candidatus Bathyarchaeota archaeon]
MDNVEIVSDDLYIVKQEMRPGWYCCVILIFGEKNIGVVDTGYENTPVDHVFPLISKKGRRLDEVNLIVNTHRDGDHVRGNAVFKERTGATIAVHELEYEAVPTADAKLRDGDQVRLGDRNFTVIHTPGHRPGSICLFDHGDKTLIVGDSVCGERADLIRMDKEVYIASLRKLFQVEAGTMIMSHPFPPVGRSTLVGGEVKEMIRTSIEVAKKLAQAS